MNLNKLKIYESAEIFDMKKVLGTRVVVKVKLQQHQLQPPLLGGTNVDYHHDVKEELGLST
jgi:hypothetical protein